jgi:hypothetical protein
LFCARPIALKKLTTTQTTEKDAPIAPKEEKKLAANECKTDK